ncbi:hypothetical protein BDY19DRAFT_991554 [Irpex rosettiformis]|uniref:Uncharacterized protein n=1 Tax=Irpex rosettiformis TaxID=378272 RepID=A0ACB8U9N0_9APHY|nr:hypothetical protein BDY19DRAFT_991554 [Irpex rosettiformis]
MSRIPQPPSRNTTRSPAKSSSLSTPSSRLGTTNASSSTRTTKPPASPTTPATSRTLRPQASMKSMKPLSPASPQKSPVRRTPTKTTAVEDGHEEPKTPPMSIREQIALRRAEAKKAAAAAASKGTGFDSFEGLEDALPDASKEEEEEGAVDLGRWSVKETIERARSTGAINLASRALPCLPSALFEIHLGIKPEPLKSVPVEPPITTASSDETSASRRRAANHSAPSWFEAQDLAVLKAWSNDILEIQPEISMFGSLKAIDLHNNKLTSLPDSFADLTVLTSLDLSHNELNNLPTNFWALPSLATLNLSHNHLESLPFFSPFSTADSNPLSRTRDPRGDWYSNTITRATVPLPKLTNLDVSHNRLAATRIDHGPGQLPAGLAKLNLSTNPLGNAASLVRALSRLDHLSEFVAGGADIGDDSFPVNVLSEAYTPFPALSILDVGETQVTRAVVEAALLPVSMKRVVDFDVTTEAPKASTLRVVVGKLVIKEAWELEAEQRVKTRARNHSMAGRENDSLPLTVAKPEAVKEAWEVEAEQGLLTEGGRRRARATVPAVRSPSPQKPHSPPSSSSVAAAPRPKAVEKEAWEIEAEQGLLTAGGRRRARAAAAAAALSVSPSHTPSPSSTPASSPTPSTSALANPQYYNSAAHKLTLPPLSALPKASHMRSFSLAAAKVVASSSSAQDLSLAIPTPTLPLAAITLQPFSDALRSLVLTGRRIDQVFNLPAHADGPFLPRLEELNLENCGLSDSVAVSRSQGVLLSGNDTSTSRTHESILSLIARLFPSLKTLDLSYNSLTSASLSSDALSRIILSCDAQDNGEPARAGLKHLRLRGNRLTELDGFQVVAEAFKGNRLVAEWGLEELDLRDNEIGRLPPEIGLLPMDVFLVDGNVFRVPARRVWEREGTKGLLSWLRGRIE